ncbi:MAG TPA: YdeI/OmpD-associated family protein [Candidatus Paceibacterota bacterium]|nr:YdeI/OmpD-associated family protein [Candidatus Paceibacterota bacterium]
MATKISNGTVHTVPADMKKVLLASQKLHTTWESLTPLARNEWICLVTSTENPETRARRLERTRSQLMEGKRRPCCWAGCMHRTDKKLSPSQKFVRAKAKK